MNLPNKETVFKNTENIRLALTKTQSILPLIKGHPSYQAVDDVLKQQEGDVRRSLVHIETAINAVYKTANKFANAKLINHCLDEENQ